MANGIHKGDVTHNQDTVISPASFKTRKIKNIKEKYIDLSNSLFIELSTTIYFVWDTSSIVVLVGL